ncbi:centractin- actin- protein of the dynactin complex [Malassezia brasiliensis]|uniref:Centractin n=1 Tax=Malassezia brasiliensis TaxID=1821822 RepID=A0AAF0DVJ4_9BASI|nr:centractin- actin- protein of the dynactin complex [Malassezia brasiliensis]
MASEYADVLTNQPVVIDNGSGTIKAGFAGQDTPKCFFPNFVGRPKHVRAMAGAAEGDRFIGRSAQELRGLLKIRYPMEHGIVTDWADMEHIWSHMYADELKTLSEEHPVLLTEAPLNPRANREQAAQIFFETFNVPAMYVSIQAILSLYASGRTTGVVLDSGDGVTHAVPVYEGFAMPHAIQRIDVAGRDVAQHLQMLLRRAGYYLHTSAEREIVRAIKEQRCQLALPGHDDRDAKRPVEFALPDGNVIKLGAERFRAPEVLFRPELVGLEDVGAHQILADAIARADMDLRRGLYGNIVLSGGTTLTKGYGDRLLHETKRLAPPDLKIKISAPPERKYSTWIGGSIFAGLSTFRKLWVSAEEYQEDPDCIHKVEMHLPAGARESFEVLSGLSEPLAPHTADSRRVTDLLDANLDHKRHFREPRDYTIIKSLGTGSFGTVYVADWQSPLPSGAMVPAMQHSLTRPAYAGKRLVAIKRMKKPFAAWEDCIKLNELRCMEGNLYQLTKTRRGRPLAQGLVASILHQVLAGLHHVHTHGFFHRDLKPENLLITTTGLADYPAKPTGDARTPVEQDVLVVVKIADFGLAREITSAPPYTEYVSTRWYRAPEILLHAPHYSPAVDMWALGAIAAELVLLEPLFPGTGEMDQVLRIAALLGNPLHASTHDATGTHFRGGGRWSDAAALAAPLGFRFPDTDAPPFASLFPAHVSHKLVHLVFSMLRYDPAARVLPEACLRHAYFTVEAPLLHPRSKLVPHANVPGLVSEPGAGPPRGVQGSPRTSASSSPRYIHDDGVRHGVAVPHALHEQLRNALHLHDEPRSPGASGEASPQLMRRRTPGTPVRRTGARASMSHESSPVQVVAQERAAVHAASGTAESARADSPSYARPSSEGRTPTTRRASPARSETSGAPASPHFLSSWVLRKGGQAQRQSKEEQLKRREAELLAMRERSRAVLQKRSQILGNDQHRGISPTP